jgi:tetratricopeptide (TPR) repeat protein
MKPGRWAPLERAEGEGDQVRYRWPFKTERLWDDRLQDRLGTDVRGFFERLSRSLVGIHPAPAFYVFFPVDTAISGHLARIRRASENLLMANYALFRKKRSMDQVPGYSPTGLMLIRSQYVLRNLAEESPLFAALRTELKDIPPDDCGIYLAEAPDAAWLASIQPDEARLYAAFRNTRQLDKVGLPLQPPSPAAKEQLEHALDLSFEDDLAACQAVLEDLLQRHPDYWRAWGPLMSCLLEQGRHRQAYAMVQDIQRRHADCPLVDRLGVRCGMENRDWVRAEWHLKRLWGLNPWDPFYTLQYATVAFETRNYPLAVRLYEDCAEQANLHDNDRIHYGVALGKLGRHQQALDILMELDDEDDPAPELLQHIGALLIAAGRPRDGLAYGRRAVELDDQSSSAWDSLGLAHLKLGNLAEATAAFLKAIHLHQESPSAWRHLLHAYHRGGQVDKLEGAKAFTRQTLPGELARFEREKETGIPD